MIDYQARCDSAATAQGLDPLTAALTRASIPHGIAQTGGWCMAVTIPTDTGTYVAVASERVSGEWCLAYYDGNTWDNGDADAEWEAYGMTLAAVLGVLTPTAPAPGVRLTNLDRARRMVAAYSPLLPLCDYDLMLVPSLVADLLDLAESQGRPAADVLDHAADFRAMTADDQTWG